MEPQTHYVTSADGTRIAMWMIGRGRPLVINHPVGLASIDARWKSRQYRDGHSGWRRIAW
jgi:hypothetical protein